MQRLVVSEVVARGKDDDYKAWFDARNKIFEDLGYEPWKMYAVQHRTMNMVCVITPEFEPEEWQQQWAKVGSDEPYQTLQREMYYGKNIVLDGTTEIFWLTSD